MRFMLYRGHFLLGWWYEQLMAARFGWYTDFFFASRSSQLGAEKEKGYVSNILRFQRR
jgi:hypothetical protein